MSLILQAYISAQQHILPWVPSVIRATKTENPLKLGILSSATFNISEMMHAVMSHPDVALYSIATDHAPTVASFAAKHGFQRHYATYESLLTDPEVDFIYISLPTSLHFEWVFKSLEAGKHVLIEPPFTSNAIEAELLIEQAERRGKVLMEGCHWQFHPAAHRFRQILDSEVYGGIVSTSAGMSYTPAVPRDDPRWQYELSGGSLMDVGYVVGLTRFALREGAPDDVLYAHAEVNGEADPRVDSSMYATLRYRLRNVNVDSGDNNIYSTIYTDMARSPAYGIIPRIWELPSVRVETENYEIYFYNALLPHIYHYIGIKDKSTGTTKYESSYKGGPLWNERGGRLWSTYRYQLEAFVDKLRGRRPVWWITGEDSLAQMKTIDQVYTASGLPLRPTSSFVEDNSS